MDRFMPQQDPSQPPIRESSNSSPPPPSEPPAYAPHQPHRAIADLRAQIIANGSVIRPHKDVNKSSDDHIELVVAKAPASSLVRRPRRQHVNEKDGISPLHRGGDPTRTNAPAASSSSGTAKGEKHYAVLLKRSGSNRTIYVIVQGEPRDTVEEALEWMLERTERMCHDLIVRHGRLDSGDGCIVM